MRMERMMSLDGTVADVMVPVTRAPRPMLRLGVGAAALLTSAVVLDQLSEKRPPSVRGTLEAAGAGLVTGVVAQGVFKLSREYAKFVDVGWIAKEPSGASAGARALKLVSTGTILGAVSLAAMSGVVLANRNYLGDSEPKKF